MKNTMKKLLALLLALVLTDYPAELSSSFALVEVRA